MIINYDVVWLRLPDGNESAECRLAKMFIALCFDMTILVNLALGLWHFINRNIANHVLKHSLFLKLKLHIFLV